MPNYLVNMNAQPNGDHEVHETTCQHLPTLPNRLTLGFHHDCKSAVITAKRQFPTANGCYYCCYACHTT
jgi:hypothetical protein